MYIRRKVFSILEVEGEEKLFSTTEVEIQKEFAKVFKNKNEKNKKGYRAAGIIGGMSGLGGGIASAKGRRRGLKILGYTGAGAISGMVGLDAFLTKPE